MSVKLMPNSSMAKAGVDNKKRSAMMTEDYMKDTPDESLKKDAGKVRWELLPLQCIEGMVKVLTFGAKKYEDDGWKKLMQTEEGLKRVIGSARRHQVALEKQGIGALDLNEYGEVDEDHSGLPHIDHFMCNVLFQKYRQLYLEGHIE
jgi:hypothetical protein